jgi:hypothetical protein
MRLPDLIGDRDSYRSLLRCHVTRRRPHGKAATSAETWVITLAAVAHTLVSDVANVIRINAFRSTPLIVDGPTNTKLALERPFSPWPEFIE